MQPPHDLALPILDRRLSAASPAPLAVAFSGGGDSLALLLITLDWARAHGRSVVALTVDHGLNPLSGGWTARCGETARRLGADFQALNWVGEKPATGLSAAARAARHALLAEAAREAGARVILMGHTADDLAESAAMRAEGSSVPDARQWAPSPAWPQGRDLFLLRPLLDVGRQALRDYLRQAGETWIDDPANADMRSARSRARAALTAGAAAADPSRRAPGPTAAPSDPGVSGTDGILTLPRSAAPATIAMAALCAAGTTRPPRSDSLSRIAAGLRAGEPFVTTLAGARIVVGWADIQVMRDAGEVARGGLPSLSLTPGLAMVWDGRFEIAADQPGLTVRALARLAPKLPESQRRRLKSIPAACRPTLPVIVDADGGVSCPILAGDSPVRCRALVLPRFEAARGGIDIEPGP
ncbi:MAG: tRNA lysidine(34) synthetase TilS [Caulobacter sp.]|nr:tRNA lysidine(34) synthetase TilS [Caulobacter sp.]